MEGSERPAPPRQLIPESMSLPTRRFVASPNKIGPYYVRAKIGEGGFSRIRIATDELGREYACKIVSKLFGSEVHTTPISVSAKCALASQPPRPAPAVTKVQKY